MRMIWLIGLIYGWFGLGVCWAQQDDTFNKAQEDFFYTLPTAELNAVINELNRDSGEAIPSLDWPTVKEIAANGLMLDMSFFSNKLVMLAGREIVNNLHLLGQLICLTAICAILRNLELNSGGSGVAAAAHSVCFAILLILAARIFYNGAALAKETVDGMVSFMNAILPIFITLLTVSGNVAASALLSPLMIMAVNCISFITGKIIVPFLMMSLVIECANYFIKPYRLSGLASLLKQSGILLIGFMMMLFVGIMAIQGTAGGISDGLTLRTAKFATASFVPVVGKLLADTVEVLFSASLLLRSSIGIFGVIVVFMVCFLPCLKLFIIGLLVKLSGACIEPLGDSQMADCLGAIGNNLYLLAAVMLIIAVMFFLMLVMFVFTGSITAALK